MYVPNFQDPRVKRRVLKVLAWAEPRLSWHVGEFIDSSELTGVFGNQTSNPLSKWLREVVLRREHDSWVVGEQSYAYLISWEGCKRLRILIGDHGKRDQGESSVCLASEKEHR